MKWMIMVMYADTLAVKDVYYFKDEHKAREKRVDLIVENPNCIIEMGEAI